MWGREVKKTSRVRIPPIIMSKSSCEAIFFIVINYMPRDKKKLSKKQKKNPDEKI